MKTLTLLALSLLTTASFAQSAAPAAAQVEGKAHVLNRAEFDQLASKPDKLLVIDVRRPDELTNIGGFPVYLSVQLADLEKSTAWIPKERRIVVVSNHAHRAVRGADLLAAKGFKVVGAVGVQDYEAEGGKLTKVAPPAPKTAAVN